MSKSQLHTFGIPFRIARLNSDGSVTLQPTHYTSRYDAIQALTSRYPYAVPSWLRVCQAAGDFLPDAHAKRLFRGTPGPDVHEIAAGLEGFRTVSPDPQGLKLVAKSQPIIRVSYADVLAGQCATYEGRTLLDHVLRHPGFNEEQVEMATSTGEDQLFTFTSLGGEIYGRLIWLGAVIDGVYHERKRPEDSALVVHVVPCVYLTPCRDRQLAEMHSIWGLARVMLDLSKLAALDGTGNLNSDGPEPQDEPI